jgi:Ankyrin repeats (3 copies)
VRSELVVFAGILSLVQYYGWVAYAQFDDGTPLLAWKGEFLDVWVYGQDLLEEIRQIFGRFCFRRTQFSTFLAHLRGADPNVGEDRGRTALMKAASSLDASVVKRLLKANANRDAKDLDGNTAASLARKLGRSDIAELLQPSSTG